MNNYNRVNGNLSREEQEQMWAENKARREERRAEARAKEERTNRLKDLAAKVLMGAGAVAVTGALAFGEKNPPIKTSRVFFHSNSDNIELTLGGSDSSHEVTIDLGDSHQFVIDYDGEVVREQTDDGENRYEFTDAEELAEGLYEGGYITKAEAEEIGSQDSVGADARDVTLETEE